jgi:hypothetical protein
MQKYTLFLNWPNLFCREVGGGGRKTVSIFCIFPKKGGKKQVYNWRIHNH